jgi:hypothetical protein
LIVNIVVNEWLTLPQIRPPATAALSAQAHPTDDDWDVDIDQDAVSYVFEIEAARQMGVGSGLACGGYIRNP